MQKGHVTRVFVFSLLASVLFPFSFSSPVFAATNLIANPSLEMASSDPTIPQGWHQGEWGTNAATFTYPVAGIDGASAARIDMNSYTSGDAKWYFDNVPVVPGQTYTFSDAYQSNVPTNVTIQYQMTDGTYTYVWLSSPQASSAWATASANFTVPANVSALTIFHTLNAIGSLTVDKYDLEQVAALPPVPPPTGGNLIPNATLVASSDPTTPSNWHRGGWGTNTRVLSYPVAGYNGAIGLQTQITSYTDGDAKWYTDPIPVTGGSTIEYSDMYESDIGSVVTAMFTMSDGTVQYMDLASPTASASWNSIHATISVPAEATSVTLFHLINQVGLLTISDPSLTIGASAAFSQGMVTFTFDDGDQSVYDNAKPILDAAGIKPTLYIVSNFIGSDDYYMTTAELHELNDEGYDIGGHTRNHLDLTTLTPAQITDEVTGNRNDLLGMGFTSVSTFAYPYGTYNDQVVQAVKDAGYIAARSVNSGFNDAATDHYLIMDQHVENNVTPAQIEAWIDQAVAEKKWLILEMHNQVAGDPDLYSNSPATLQAVVDYVTSHGVKTVTMAQGAQMLQP